MSDELKLRQIVLDKNIYEKDKLSNYDLNELKPCPFCGGKAKLEDHRLIWVVNCEKCEVAMLGERAPEPEDEEDEDSIDWYYYKKSAVTAWNRRVNKGDKQ